MRGYPLVARGQFAQVKIMSSRAKDFASLGKAKPMQITNDRDNRQQSKLTVYINVGGKTVEEQMKL